MEEAKPQILLWTAPECPYRVTIPAPVINEIRILAVEAFYSVPRGGVEIGGVFFGIREADALHIHAHRPIKCQYATGPSFSLSIKDQLELSGLLEKALVDPELAGMAALGWYHSHTRSEIFLSPADLQLYSEFFPERWQIAMVLRPTNLQPTRAGFFFRDRLGAVKGESPLQEFKLEPPDFGMVPLDGDVPGPGIAQELSAKVAPAMDPTPAPESVIVPPKKAVLTAVAAPLPIPAPPPSATHSPIPNLPSLGNGSGALENEDSLITARILEGLDGPTIAVPVPTRAISTPEPVVHAEPGLPGFLNDPAATPVRSRFWIWAVLAILLLCGAGAAAALKWGKLGKSSDLGLETYDINGAFLIRWDRESALIRSATGATLEIQDGAEKNPFPLTRLELAAGGYGYIRRTGQVSVRLRVDGPTPAEEFSNFNSAQSFGSQQVPTPDAAAGVAQALAEKEHLKTELINESMQSLELRREITELKRQLAEERAKSTSAPAK